MRITLHQCQVFECVAQKKSITRAAETMHLTQPAVSNLIRQLEEMTQSRLIEVIGKVVHLTEEGKLLLHLCQDLHQRVEQFKAQLLDLQGGVGGTLRVAVVTTAKYFMPKLLGDFKHHYPDVSIELTVTNRADVIKRLKENLDDFVIMSQPPNEIPVTINDFYEDQLVIASSVENPLSAKKRVSLKVLENEAWLVREPGSGTRMAMEAWFKKTGITPNIAMEISNNEAIKQSIIANMGISIISLQSIELELSVNQIALVNTPGFPERHEWYMVTNKGKHTSPVTEKFLSFIHQHEHINYNSSK